MRTNKKKKIEAHVILLWVIGLTIFYFWPMFFVGCLAFMWLGPRDARARYWGSLPDSRSKNFADPYKKNSN